MDKLHKLRFRIDAIERISGHLEDQNKAKDKFTDLIYELIASTETYDEEQYILEQIEGHPLFLTNAKGHWEWSEEENALEWIELE
ncbi:MAG: hypothetical protein WCK54_18825 [Desulfuromonadales bacterium]